MSPMLATASAVISLALVAYTIGVFSERRSGASLSTLTWRFSGSA